MKSFNWYCAAWLFPIAGICFMAMAMLTDNTPPRERRHYYILMIAAVDILEMGVIMYLAM